MLTKLSQTFSHLISRIDLAAWFLLVISLPVTSFPLVSVLAGGSMVAPPAGVLALVLVATWLFPQWIKGRALPRQSIPLILFAASALVSCLSAYFIEFPAFRAVNFTRQQGVELATLIIGISIYLLTATYLRDERRLQSTLRWINWSGLVILLWCGVQFVMWQWQKNYPAWMDQFQTLFSISRLFEGRVTGFAMEPSWLAHMLNMLYLPLWLAASVRQFSAHGWRIVRLTFENLLLVGGVAVLWFSLSRVGLLAFLFMLVLVFILLNLALVGWLERRFISRNRWKGISPQALRRWLRVVLAVALILFYLATLLGTAFVISRLDQRMTRLFDFSTLAEEGVFSYANQLMMAERVVFWQLGWEVFNVHPWMGVGLGNSGYFFQELIPGSGLELYEVNQILYRETYLPNTKSLWTRLLSETGLVGIAFFIAWLFLQWASGDALSRTESRMQRALGLAGQLVVLGLLVEGFSVDTFALPYFWFLLGLSTSAAKIST